MASLLHVQRSRWVGVRGTRFVERGPDERDGTRSDGPHGRSCVSVRDRTCSWPAIAATGGGTRPVSRESSVVRSIKTLTLDEIDSRLASGG